MMLIELMVTLGLIFTIFKVMDVSDNFRVVLISGAIAFGIFLA